MDVVARPATWPDALMANASLDVPPSVPRLVTVNRTSARAGVAKATRAMAATAAAAAFSVLRADGTRDGFRFGMTCSPKSSIGSNAVGSQHGLPKLLFTADARGQSGRRTRHGGDAGHANTTAVSGRSMAGRSKAAAAPTLAAGMRPGAKNANHS